MGRIGVRLALVVLSIAVASPAMARSGYWMHTTEEDPFSGDMHMAVVSDDFDQMAGFRCTKADDLALIFIPVQKPGELADASYFAAASNEIAVIIDDSPKMTIKADVDITAKGDHFRYTSGANEVVNLAFKAAAANKRFAIAAVTNGKVYFFEDIQHCRLDEGSQCTD